MQMHFQFYLSLIWILISQDKAKAQDDPHWKINVNQTINATNGSNVIISCKFEIPPEQKTNIKVYWKIKGSSSKKDSDNLAFAFHPDSSCIDPHFQNRTKLVGEASEGNCSLQISNIREGEAPIYLRVSGWNKSYSFIEHLVYIKVDGQNLGFLSHIDDPPIMFIASARPDVHDFGRTLYLAILVPLLGLLVIAAAVIVTYKMHKRSHMLKCQESGYYANFKRTLSTPRKSEPFCKTSNEVAPDEKVIDEPVYVNLETTVNQMHQQGKTVDNIYGNVDYTT